MAALLTKQTSFNEQTCEVSPTNQGSKLMGGGDTRESRGIERDVVVLNKPTGTRAFEVVADNWTGLVQDQPHQSVEWLPQHDLLLRQLVLAVGKDINMISMLFPGFSVDWLELRMELQSHLMIPISTKWTCQEDLALLALIRSSLSNPHSVESVDFNMMFPNKDLCEVLQREEYLRSQLPQTKDAESHHTDSVSGEELTARGGGLTVEEEVDCGTFGRSSQVYLSCVGPDAEQLPCASLMDCSESLSSDLDDAISFPQLVKGKIDKNSEQFKKQNKRFKRSRSRESHSQETGSMLGKRSSKFPLVEISIEYQSGPHPEATFEGYSHGDLAEQMSTTKPVLNSLKRLKYNCKEVELWQKYHKTLSRTNS